MFSVTNKQKRTRDYAKQVMKDAWQSHDLDEVVHGRTSREAYKRLALRVKASLGSNLINDDVNINRDNEDNTQRRPRKITTR